MNIHESFTLKSTLVRFWREAATLLNVKEDVKKTKKDLCSTCVVAGQQMRARSRCMWRGFMLLYRSWPLVVASTKDLRSGVYSQTLVPFEILNTKAFP